MKPVKSAKREQAGDVFSSFSGCISNCGKALTEERLDDEVRSICENFAVAARVPEDTDVVVLVLAEDSTSPPELFERTLRPE